MSSIENKITEILAPWEKNIYTSFDLMKGAVSEIYYLVGNLFDEPGCRLPTLDKWKGIPVTHMILKINNETKEFISFKQDIFKVHKIIEEASEIECLTSSSEYIREYKKWISRGEK